MLQAGFTVDPTDHEPVVVDALLAVESERQEQARREAEAAKWVAGEGRP